MITIGSIDRETAAAKFPFLASGFRGRRCAIKELTHLLPDFVFWIHPDGRLHDARDSHLRHLPRGFEHIVDDEPDYCGFLRGRIVTQGGQQLIVVYCRPEALAEAGPSLDQFLLGIDQVPTPVHESAWIISDNADLYGTLADLRERSPR